MACIYWNSKDKGLGDKANQRRRLKCDRTHPCNRCTRRGDAASCTYIGHGPRGRVNQAMATSPSHIQNRIQHLENLILSFAQQKKQVDESGSGSASGVGSGGDSNGRGAAHDSSASATLISSAANVNGSKEPSPETTGAVSQKTPVEDDPGKLLNDGTTYVDASNWQAILDDVPLSPPVSEMRLINNLQIAQRGQEIRPRC